MENKDKILNSTLSEEEHCAFIQLEEEELYK